MRVTLTQKNHRFVFIILALFVVLGAVASIVYARQAAFAAPVPESCFVFNTETGAIEGYNPADDPICVSDITIPASINGVTVQTFDSEAFVDDTITSITFPDTITSIPSGTFTYDASLSSITLDVTGDLTLSPSAFGEIGPNGAIFVHADGNLEVRSGFNGSDLSTLNFSAGNNLLLTGSSFAGGSIESAQFTAGGNFTIQGGSIGNATIDTVEITAAGNASIYSGSFSGSTIGAMSIDANTNIDIIGGLYGGSTSVGSLDIDAGGALSINSSGLSSLQNLSSASLAAGTGQLLLSGSSFSGVPTLNTLDITAPSGLRIDQGSLSYLTALDEINFHNLGGDAYIYGLNSTGLTHFDLSTSGSITTTNGAFSGSSQLSDVNLQAGGNITTNNGSFTGTSLETIDFQADGSVTVTGSALSGLPSMTTAMIDAGVNLSISGGSFSSLSHLEEVNFAAGQNLTLGSGTLSTSSSLQSAHLTAGDTLAIGPSVMIFTSLNDLVLNAGNALTIGDSSFSNNQLRTLTLPASLSSIEPRAFQGTQLEAVYLNSTPSIDADSYIFALAGATYNTNTATYDDLDQVKLVPIYTTEPHTYTHTIYAPVDVDGDDVADQNGGYLINPASTTIHYRSSSNETLRPSITSVGTINDTLLTDYLLSSNPTLDLDAYYAAGDDFTAVAPEISPYHTPAAQNRTLAAGQNVFTLLYTTDSDGNAAGAPNTGLNTASHFMWTIAAGLVGLATIIAILVVQRRLNN